MNKVQSAIMKNNFEFNFRELDISDRFCGVKV